MGERNNVDIDIENLSLEQCIYLRDKLTRRIERTKEQLYLEEHFFFMKEKNKLKISYQERVIDCVAEFISELYKLGFTDEEDFDLVYTKLVRNAYAGYGNRLKDSFTYFYNEAIPMEEKSSIFSYKRKHKRVDTFDDTVKHYILNIAKEYRKERLGFLDPPKEK